MKHLLLVAKRELFYGTYADLERCWKNGNSHISAYDFETDGGWSHQELMWVADCILEENEIPREDFVWEVIPAPRAK